MSIKTRIASGAKHAPELIPGEQNPLRVVIYARVANAHPQDSQAASLQLTACRRFAGRERFCIVREYVDLAKPAQYSQQVAMQQLLIDLDEKRDAVFIVVQAYLRLGRNVIELRRIFGQINVCGADVVTVASCQQDRPTTSQRRITL